MKNRRSLRKSLFRNFAYFEVDKTRRGAIQDLLREVFGEGGASPLPGDAKPPVNPSPSRGGDSYGAGRVAQQLEGLLNDMAGGRYTVFVEPDGRGRFQITVIPNHFIPIDPEHFQQMLQELANMQPHTLNADNQNTNLWINTPRNQPSREMVQSLTRNLFANAQLNQDGLHALLNSPQFQGLFQGGKMINGALSLLPPSLQASIVLSFATRTESPDLAKALLLAGQGLPAVFSGMDPAKLSQMIQNLSRALNLAQPGSEQVLKSLTQLFSATGMGSLKEVEAFVKALMSHEVQNHPEGSSLVDKLRQWAEKMTLSNHPQFVGMSEYAQGGSTLNQMLGSILRALMGVLMMNQQNQWPRALPNEQMLSELATLLAARARRDLDKDDRKAKRRKRREDEEALTSYYPYFDSPEEEEEKESDRSNS